MEASIALFRGRDYYSIVMNRFLCFRLLIALAGLGMLVGSSCEPLPTAREIDAGNYLAKNIKRTTSRVGWARKSGSKPAFNRFALIYVCDYPLWYLSKYCPWYNQ